MVNLLPASDTPFGDPDQFAAFLGEHDIAHATIARVLAAAGRQITVIPLADGPLHSRDWMLDHWQIHLDIGRATGIAVPDLAGYDLDDERQFYDWMQAHGLLHSAINLRLGI